MSSIVSELADIIPRPLAMALAVMGCSPVTMTTLTPAHWQRAMASGTEALGGSISDTRPRKRRLRVGKFSWFGSNS